MNFKQLSEHFINELAGLYDPDELNSVFNIVVGHVSGFDRRKLLLKSLENVSDANLSSYLLLLKELKTGKPLQYVLGETVFYGLPFKVNPTVLIPRPETEELVEWVIETVAHLADPRVIDIGTGSGCIAISVKKNVPGADVSALDISKEALSTASVNSLLNEVVVDFIEADIRSYVSLGKFDIIVSNPPYITLDEKKEMHENVLEHEPHLALFVANENPLEFYKTIADFALKNLNRNGYLFFEINEHMGEKTMQMLSGKSFINIEVRKDMQGKDRMIKCELASGVELGNY